MFKRGRGHGIVALENGDGTWNVEFDDDGAEGDFYAEDRQRATQTLDRIRLNHAESPLTFLVPRCRTSFLLARCPGHQLVLQ